MTRPSIARVPTDEGTQDPPTNAPKAVAAADASGATTRAACDTGATARTAMPPRSPSPQGSAQPAAVAVQRRAASAHPDHALDTAVDEAPQPPLSHHDAAESVDPHEPHEPLGPDDPLAPPPFNPYKGNRGVTRAWHALKNSIAGFRVAIEEESAFRQELTLAAILLPIGLVIPVEPVARVLLLGSVMLVLIVELINSSIENAIDRIGLERNELSKRAKDLGSAAVTVALVLCVMTWGLILVPLFGPPFVHWLASL